MSRRSEIHMTPAEVEEFLTRCNGAVIAAVGAGGWPIGGVARVERDGEAVCAQPPLFDPLLQCLRNDQAVCCLFEESPSYYGIRGATVYGRASAARRADAPVQIRMERVTSFDFGKLPTPPRVPEEADET